MSPLDFFHQNSNPHSVNNFTRLTKLGNRNKIVDEQTSQTHSSLFLASSEQLMFFSLECHGGCTSHVQRIGVY